MTLSCTQIGLAAKEIACLKIAEQINALLQSVVPLRFENIDLDIDFDNVADNVALDQNSFFSVAQDNKDLNNELRPNRPPSPPPLTYDF